MLRRASVQARLSQRLGMTVCCVPGAYSAFRNVPDRAHLPQPHPCQQACCPPAPLLLFLFTSEPVPDYPAGGESGGLSGPPLFELSTRVLADMYKLTGNGARCRSDGFYSC
jgi:hypothetical protein